MDKTNDDLSAVFEEYRDAAPVPEASARFMPRLWERIDARRVFTLRLKRLSQVFVGVSAAFCLVLTGVTLAIQPSSPVHHATYLDALAEAHPIESLDAQGLVAPHPETPEANR